MSYKGSDLDLRTLDAYLSEDKTDFGPEPGGDLRLSALQMPLEAPMGNELPIPVDRTVLACCNQAHDIAVFHAAAEVRPEHLLHALTRVDAARDTLEKQGLRTDALRRDSAVAIASELPARGAGSQPIPRASAAFEQLLRRAGALAGGDSAMASVHDIMRALLSQGREQPTARMLLAAATDPAELERWAAQPATLRPSLAGAALQPDAVHMLMARVESLEAALGAQAAEARADRRAMLDLMAELQREWRAARAETAPPTETRATLTARLDSLGQSVAQLAERFEAIRVFAPEGGEMPSRLTALETKLAGQPSAIADAVAFMLNERRDAGPDEATAPDPAAERLAALEGMARTQGQQLEEAAKAREHDRDELHEALVKLGTNQQTLASNLEAWRLDSSGDISIISNRLEALERRLQDAAARRWRIRLPAAEADGGGSTSRTHSFKRWLNRTGEMLPSTWRHDAAALRQSLRVLRRDGKA